MSLSISIFPAHLAVPPCRLPRPLQQRPVRRSQGVGGGAEETHHIGGASGGLEKKGEKANNRTSQKYGGLLLHQNNLE